MTTLNAVQAVTEAYLAITQDIAQGVAVKQIISTNCFPEGNACLECVKYLKEGFENEGKYTVEEINEKVADLCKYTCDCNITQVNLETLAAINFEAMNAANAFELFLVQVENSLFVQAANNDGNGLFGLESEQADLEVSVQHMYEALTTEVFQETVQKLKTLQVIELEGPGNIAHVDMRIATEFISNVIQTSQVTQAALSELEANMVAMAVEVANAGLMSIIEIIIWILLIAIVAVMIYLLVSLMSKAVGNAAWAKTSKTGKK